MSRDVCIDGIVSDLTDEDLLAAIETAVTRIDTVLQFERPVIERVHERPDEKGTDPQPA